MIHARAVGFFCLFVLIEVDIDYLCSCRCLVFKLIFFLGLFFFLRQTPRSVTETLHAVSGPKSLPQAFVWKEKAKMQTTPCLGDSLKVSFQTREVSCHISPIRVLVGCCHRVPAFASGIVHLLHIDGCVGQAELLPRPALLWSVTAERS